MSEDKKPTIAEIEELLDKPNMKVVLLPNGEVDTVDYEEVIATLQAQLEQFRWVPVTERLPGADDIVDAIVKITTLSKKVNRVRIPCIRWSMTRTYPNSHVFTHWMFSPQFPKEAT